MRNGLLGVTAAGFILLTSAVGFAGDVNCGIVMKSVKMGRSAQDIADTMMISTADIEKCKADAAKAPEAGKPGEPAGDKPAKEGAKPEAEAH